MKYYCVFSVIAATLLPVTASAADAVFKNSGVSASTAVSEKHDWSGFYAGASVQRPLSGGVHAGYNYQTSGNVVVGAEVDGSLFKSNKKPASVKSLGTARVRVGYAFDRVLPYIDGGVAIGRAKAGSEAHTHLGYAVGAGVEYALTDKVSTRLTYSYTKLKDRTYNAGVVGVRGSTIGAGFSVKF